MSAVKHYLAVFEVSNGKKSSNTDRKRSNYDRGAHKDTNAKLNQIKKWTEEI